MTFEFADRAIRDLNKRNLRAFDRLKTLKFDELNVMSAVSKTYDDSVRLAKKRYWQIAMEAYIDAMILADIERKEAEKRAEDNITEDWVIDMLEDYDLVTLYQFDNEVERKKQRTVESIMANHNKNEAIDKSLRLWSQQLAQYADNSVVRATIDGFRDAGVKYVKWVSERDERVCQVCHDLDGKVFPIDDVPPPAHYHCRCVLVAVNK